MTERTARAKTGFWRQLPLLAGLVLLWMLLWGQLSPLSLTSGVLVAVVVTRVFVLPPVELSGRFNLGWALLFLARFLGDLVVASVEVAWLAVRPRAVEHNAVIAVQLRTRSDIVTTLTSISVSLIPGSIVIEVDRQRAILYLHSLAVERGDGVERVRERVLAVERGIVRALGSREDLRRTEES